MEIKVHEGEIDFQANCFVEQIVRRVERCPPRCVTYQRCRNEVVGLPAALLNVFSTLLYTPHRYIRSNRFNRESR